MKTAMAAMVVIIVGLSLLVLPVRAPAQEAPGPAQLATEVSVTVPGGKVVFSNLAFEYQDFGERYGGSWILPYLSGRVVNATSRNWEEMHFLVKLYDKSGNPIRNLHKVTGPDFELVLVLLDRGETRGISPNASNNWIIDRSVWGLGPSRYEIVWVGGKVIEPYDPRRGWKPIQTTIIAQRGSPLQIVKAEGFWRPVEYVSSQANWVVEMTIKNTSAKTIIAYEIPSVLFNSFDERVANLTGVNAPGLRLAPGATLDTSYEQVNVGASGGSMVKVWISRVKFSDGSVWVNR